LSFYDYRAKDALLPLQKYNIKKTYTSSRK